MNRPDYQILLEHFDVLRSKFDKALFKYGSTFLIIQILISIFIFFFIGNLCS